MQLIEFARQQWRKVKRWVFWQRNLSAGAYEIRYWKKAGLAKGNDFYERYLACFKLSASDLKGKTWCDFGSGPFGGMVTLADSSAKAYAVDVLADEYNQWGYAKTRILPFKGTATEVPTSSCDLVFCLNVIDHTTKPQLIVRELERMLKPGGGLYLFVHARKEHEINDGHPLAWDEAFVRKLFSAFHLDQLTHMSDTPNDRPDLAAMAVTLTKLPVTQPSMAPAGAR